MNAERAEKLNDKKLLFIGVLTSAKYLDTKAKAVNQTWASDIQGNLEFFVGSNISFQNGNNQMPVRALHGVKDIEYPPQRKIMAMLKYMYDNYIDEYQWFMRADDDVYVRTEKLQQFLQSLDSSEDTVVGQGGTGKRQEKNKLGLIKHECYCLGGPGVFMSRSVLKKIVPNLGECLKETASGHEDVELGRCIRKYAGVSCLWAEQVSTNPCLWVESVGNRNRLREI
jgi:chondroitin sulfate synthase